MQRVAKSEQFRQAVKELLVNGKAENVSHPLDAFVRLSSRYMLQTALEQEVSEYLGRNHYRRGQRVREGYRNGYEPGNFRTANGVLQVALPQLRGTEEKFSSRLLEKLKSGSEVLNRLILEMYVRGLSCADVEDTFLDIFGRRIISRSGVSKISQELNVEFDAWRKRDLSSLNIVYLFFDAEYVALRQGTDEKEGILCAYGITSEGKKILIHLALGERESYPAWLCFMQEITERGLKEPLLIINDGNSGLRRAIREVFPYSLRQRCQVHKMRNILAKLPKDIIPELKPLIGQVFRGKTYEEGLKKGHSLIARFKKLYPSAMECLEKDLEECLTCLKFPDSQRKFIRTTNLLERTFEESRRRTKVIPRFPTEKSGLKLVFAVLIRASAKWQGLRMTPIVKKELATIRQKIEVAKTQTIASPQQAVAVS